MEVDTDKTQLHPFFRKKEVFVICCIYCNQTLSERGMQAFLLANTKVNLFSTDIAPKSAVELVGKYYMNGTCECKIKDFACLQCGNPVGYHVVLPCIRCLESRNNGHFWVFQCSTVSATMRMNDAGDGRLTWGELEGRSQTLQRSQHHHDSSENLCR